VRTDGLYPQILGPRIRLLAVNVNGMHNRIHPPFAAVVDRLDKLAADGPLQDRSMKVTLRIILRSDGTVERAEVQRSSGASPF
jgi:hypothetical protein